MEQMWSPWRSHYIQSFSGENTGQEKEECFLCAAAHADTARDEELLVVARREHCFVIMNRYPYNAGHLLVTPYRHIGDFGAITQEEMTCIMKTLQLATAIFDKVLKPHGFNLGANLGRVAGAGLPDHVHFHIVPRWNGDTNFMPVLADVKVVSESMEEIHRKLAAAFFNITE